MLFHCHSPETILHSAKLEMICYGSTAPSLSLSGGDAHQYSSLIVQNLGANVIRLAVDNLHAFKELPFWDIPLHILAAFSDVDLICLSTSLTTTLSTVR